MFIYLFIVTILVRVQVELKPSSGIFGMSQEHTVHVECQLIARYPLIHVFGGNLVFNPSRFR